jgi:hypothetical protein
MSLVEGKHLSADDIGRLERLLKRSGEVGHGKK